MSILFKINNFISSLGVFLRNGGGHITGELIPFAGNIIPNGFLLCNGNLISRTKYSKLFSVIGIIYGEGDGETTFALPNLVGRFLQGGDGTNIGTEMDAGLPNITGNAGRLTRTVATDVGCLRTVKSGNGPGGSSTSVYYYEMYLDASKSSSIYGNSETVQPPAIICNYLIKY